MFGKAPSATSPRYITFSRWAGRVAMAGVAICVAGATFVAGWAAAVLPLNTDASDGEVAPDWLWQLGVAVFAFGMLVLAVAAFGARRSDQPAAAQLANRALVAVAVVFAVVVVGPLLVASWAAASTDSAFAARPIIAAVLACGAMTWFVLQFWNRN